MVPTERKNERNHKRQTGRKEGKGRERMKEKGGRVRKKRKISECTRGERQSVQRRKAWVREYSWT